MHTKNIFTQKDPIAEAIAQIAEADYKAKMEELKGKQHKIDKNKNNKIDAHDFAILRGEKKAVKEEEQVDESSPFDWKKPREPEVKGGSGVKKGRAYGGAAQKSKPEQETDDDKKMKKEEVEQIDELSPGLINRYKTANKADREINAIDKNSGDSEQRKQAKKRDEKRMAGSNMARNRDKPDAYSDEKKSARAVSRVFRKEEVELDEASYSAKAAAAGKDIGKPGKMFGKIAKKAAGRYGSMVKGKKVAGAILAKLRKEETDYEPLLIDQIMEDTFTEINKLDEETKNEILSLVESFVSATPEQLNELSPETQYSYFKKAVAQKHSKTIPPEKKKKRLAAIDKVGAEIGKRSMARLSDKGHGGGDWYKQGRYMGDSVEHSTENQIDERTLTKGETAEKERIVKGMKKNLAGFKARYGEKAKSVMYATATKAAKKD